jgi:glycosyltransferase involved in cell wall biosynthesis
MVVVVNKLVYSFQSSGASSLFFSRFLQKSFSEDVRLIDLSENRSEEIKKYFYRSESDVIWVEQYHTIAALQKDWPDMKYCYGIHDWIFKLQRLRNPWWDLRWMRTMIREMKTFRKAQSVIHFQTPALWERLLNPSIQYLPFKILSEQTEADWKAFVFHPKTKIKFVHFGSMNATCNRLGFRHLMQVIWPEVFKEFPHLKLYVIGDTARLDDDTKEKSLSMNVHFYGFVEDWKKLFDHDCRVIHLIPWPHNTGIRTRVPETLLSGHEILAYRQCMRAYLDSARFIHLARNRGEFIRSIKNIVRSGPEGSLLKQPDACTIIRKNMTIEEA